jgi:hypothetical protein
LLHQQEEDRKRLRGLSLNQGQARRRRTLPEVPVVEVEKSASKTGSFLPTITNRDMATKRVGAGSLWLGFGRAACEVAQGSGA